MDLLHNRILSMKGIYDGDSEDSRAEVGATPHLGK